MKLLIIGSGGREHALAWKLAQSPKCSKLYCAPGNGGIVQLAECIDIKAEDIDSLLRFALKEKIGLTVVGPESPLVAGVVDKFTKAGLPIFGPTKAASELEASKVFAKDLMRHYDVPSADYKVFTESRAAHEYVRTKGMPVVVKADGLCAGKGVVVAGTTKEALDVVDSMLDKKIFGKSGERIIIEDCLFGEEASILVLSDGDSHLALASSQDHKRAFDGDRGPNTGGMGAYSPAPIVTQEREAIIMDYIVEPVIRAMESEGRHYKGLLYAGLMFTEDGPKVLEFNVRFGDPETQAILPRLESDLLEALNLSIGGTLASFELKWTKRACVCVVLASGGYPGKYETGKRIEGLEAAGRLKDVIIFHAGTVAEPKGSASYYTSGGRVLDVVALGDTIKNAIEHAYEAVRMIHFDGMHYRRDIGHRAV